MYPPSRSSRRVLCLSALFVVSWCLLFITTTFAAAPEGESLPAAADNDVAAIRKAAMEAYEKEAYAEALPLLKEVYALDPADIEVAGRLGFSAKETGAYELALATLESVVAEKTDDYYYWWWLSDTQRLLGRYAEALKSMERARDLAPEDTRAQLQDYVKYTTVLLDRTPSWENFDQHLAFSKRHQEMRRVRRQIEEYVNALDVAPPYEPDEREALGRLIWVYQELGVQYLYIEDPDAAIDYLKQALELARQAAALSEAMRYEQYLAIAWRLKADRDPRNARVQMEHSVVHWKKALDLAIETEDVVYQRYVQGRLLEAWIRLLPPEDPAVAALRQVNLKEVPWQGPANEYSTAEAVYGEARCRLHEGDYAGARVLLEMALPYFEQSKYLSDKQRIVEVYLDLAQVYFRQEHPAESLKMAEKAAAAADESRKFVDADAFNRGAGEQVLRQIAVAKARACVTLERADEAFTVMEAYHTRHFQNLLGANVVDDAMRTDAASEESVVVRRIPMLEARLARAREAGDQEEVARLEQRVAEDTARLQWLKKGVLFRSSATPDRPLTEPASLEQTQAVLGGDAVLMGYLFDIWGGIALRVDVDGVRGTLLEPGEKEIRASVDALRGAKTAEAAAGLREILVVPALLEAHAKRVVILRDENLYGLCFNLFEGLEGAVYANTAGSLLKIGEQPANTFSKLRYVMGREGMDDGLCGGSDALAAACLAGETLDLPRIVSDVQPDEVLHLGCVLEQSPPDAMLCELVFGDGAENRRLPLARLLGMKLPALLVVLDWSKLSEDAVLRPDVVMAATGLLHYAGAASILVASPGMDTSHRERFYKAFYEQLAALGGPGAVEAALQAVKDAPGDRSFYWYGMPR